MVKSKDFKYMVYATLQSGEELCACEDDIDSAMLRASRLGKNGDTVHKVVSVITTVEEYVVIDVDEMRSEMLGE